jgi:HD-like signal output (HDOD) protein
VLGCNRQRAAESEGLKLPRARVDYIVVSPDPPVRDDEFREELIARALSLPLGDLAALGRVSQLCERLSATPQDVALEASRDESFAALLLRLANSADSASVRRIADLPTAINRLGFRRVKALAVAAPGLRLLQGPPDGLEDARHELHRHAIRVGLGARLLAPLGVDRDRALIAGILHNLGLNVIALFAPEEFRYLLAATSRGEQFWQAEDSIFGFSHAELGAMLAERWSYPTELVIAIRDHDSPDPQTPLAAAVQVADLLVRSHGVGVEPPRELAHVHVLPGVDLAAAHERLGDLIAAQDRFDVHVQDAPPFAGSRL